MLVTDWDAHKLLWTHGHKVTGLLDTISFAFPYTILVEAEYNGETQSR